MKGFVLIDKEVGATSRSVDNKLQRLFHTRKVGHLGTLDPFASGLLVVAIDKGCKFLPYIDDSFKTYKAKLKLGELTTTGDLTGEIIERKEVKEINKNIIEEVFNSFIGESEQIPPMTSAIHHEGKRLYELSRKGIEVERKPRKIVIKSIKLLSINENCIEFEVNCSRGTYVRVLGEDIAKKLDTVGHLIFLRRIKVGIIDVNSSKKIDDIKEDDLINPLLLMNIPRIIIDDISIIKDIKDGKNIKLDTLEDKILLIIKDNDEYMPLAIYNRIKDDLFMSLRGLW